ncbi:hypothetical protein [Oceanobacter mangrovi]|uniref:hypothetical protein n=1 Tax=Oceanobacter mangrovi TaxID=2862510 RepID=UPI001C8F1364|nr:hypothetical protein [Oceanobacter mangrovi]
MRYLTPLFAVVALAALSGAVVQANPDAQLIEQAQQCYKHKDPVCTYQKLLAYVESDDSISLTDSTYGTPNRIAQMLERQFVEAAPTVKPETARDDSLKIISRLSSSSSHPHMYLYLASYYIVQAEACKTLSDQACLQESQAMLCLTQKQWQRDGGNGRLLNMSEEGESHLLNAMGDCQQSLQSFPLVQNLDQLIRSNLKTLEQADEQTAYKLMISPELRQQMAEDPAFAQSIGNLTGLVDQQIENLRHYSPETVMISRNGKEFRASYLYAADPEQPHNLTPVIFNTIDGKWQLYAL